MEYSHLKMILKCLWMFFNLFFDKYHEVWLEMHHEMILSPFVSLCSIPITLSMEGFGYHMEWPTFVDRQNGLELGSNGCWNFDCSTGVSPEVGPALFEQVQWLNSHFL